MLLYHLYPINLLYCYVMLYYIIILFYFVLFYITLHYITFYNYKIIYLACLKYFITKIKIFCEKSQKSLEKVLLKMSRLRNKYIF